MQSLSKPQWLYAEINKLIPKSMEMQGAQNSQNSLENKEQIWSTHASEFQDLLQSTIIKTVRYWHTRGLWLNGAELRVQKRALTFSVNGFSTRVLRQFSARKTSLFSKWNKDNWISKYKRKNLGLLLNTIYKN